MQPPLSDSVPGRRITPDAAAGKFFQSAPGLPGLQAAELR